MLDWCYVSFLALTSIRNSFLISQDVCIKLFKQRLKMMQDFILLTDIIVIISSSHLHQLPSPSFSLQLSDEYGKWIEASSEIVHDFILWQYNSLLTLTLTTTPSSLLSQEKSVVMKKYQTAKISLTKTMVVATTHSLHFVTSSSFSSYLFFLLLNGKKKTKIGAFFVSYKNNVTTVMNSPLCHNKNEQHLSTSNHLGWYCPLSPSFHCHGFFIFNEDS